MVAKQTNQWNHYDATKTAKDERLQRLGSTTTSSTKSVCSRSDTLTIGDRPRTIERPETTIASIRTKKRKDKLMVKMGVENGDAADAWVDSAAEIIIFTMTRIDKSGIEAEMSGMKQTKSRRPKCEPIIIIIHWKQKRKHCKCDDKNEKASDPKWRTVWKRTINATFWNKKEENEIWQLNSIEYDQNEKKKNQECRSSKKCNTFKL